MKLLFVHGAEKVKIDTEGNYYTEGSYNKNIWKRYEYISKDITIIFRKDSKIYSKKDAELKFQPLDKNKYNVTFVKDNLSSIKNYFNRKISKYNNNLIKEEVEKADFIIARTPSDISCKALNYARKYKKEYITEVVGCPWDSYWNYNLLGKIIAPFEYLKLRKCCKYSKNTIYVTNKFLQNRYPSKMNSIGISDVVIDSNNSNVLNARIERIKNKNNKKIIIGTLAAIDVPYKGHTTVLEAVKRLVDNGYEVEYLMAGNGSKNRLLNISQRLKIEENVKFLGNIKHSDVQSFLDNIDIYIQPSLQEGLCRSIIEAMNRGCPCIVSNVGGNPELIEKNYIFKKNNYKNLVDKIVELNDKNNLIAQANQNFKKSENYTLPYLNKIRKDYYDQIINKI